MSVNQEQYFQYCDMPERYHIWGSFETNSTSNPDAADSKGDKHWTVAYISTGLWRVTFGSNYKFTAANLVYAEAHLQLASASDKWAQVGSYVEADRTLDIRVLDASAAAVADVSADANNRIHFHVVVKATQLD
jgi:hypothetical protein